MTYTVRYAHLESAPPHNLGDKVKRGEMIGRMGTTGQSTAVHLHLDVAEGNQTTLFHLNDYDESIKPSPRQLLWFVDNELFGVEPVVTTQYADPVYFATRKKVHHGFDLVPKNRKETKANYDIYWNRSAIGTISRIGYEPSSYGHYIYVTFEA